MNFWKIWSANSFSNLGDGLYQITLPLLAAQLTRSPSLIAALGVMSTLPWLIFALQAGSIVDRSDRRKITVALPSNLGPGTYTVKWKSLSAEDGDPAAGPEGEPITFTVDPAGQPNPGKTELRPDLLNPGGGETPGPGDWLIQFDKR